MDKTVLDKAVIWGGICLMILLILAGFGYDAYRKGGFRDYHLLVGFSLAALVVSAIFVKVECRYYSKKAKVDIKGFPGIVWTFFGFWLLAIGLSPMVQTNRNSGIGMSFFVLLFLLLGHHRIKRSIKKFEIEEIKKSLRKPGDDNGS